MPTIALSPLPRPRDRNFSIALWIVVGFAGLELLAVLIHYAARLHAAHAAARPTQSTTTAVHATPAPPPSGNANTTTSVRNVAPPSSAALSASDRLLAQATALRERGDTANALARLQEASQRDPRNANVLAELATIYESIQLYDRSNETWRKIEEIGPSAGALYELAENKLRNGVAATPAPPASESQTVDSAGQPLDGEGVPEGSIFGIASISADPVPDPDAETNLRIKIDVRKRPGVAYEVGKLRINVFLYDLVDESKVVLTDADTSSEWLSPTHDWSESDTESLVVSYRRSKNHAVTSESAISAAAAAVTPGKPSHSKSRPQPTPEAQSGAETPHRRFYGYLIRVYYNDKLQTVRAEPPRLVNDAPTASSAP